MSIEAQDRQLAEQLKGEQMDRDFKAGLAQSEHAHAFAMQKSMQNHERAIIDNNRQNAFIERTNQHFMNLMEGDISNKLSRVALAFRLGMKKRESGAMSALQDIYSNNNQAWQLHEKRAGLLDTSKKAVGSRLDAAGLTVGGEVDPTTATKAIDDIFMQNGIDPAKVTPERLEGLVAMGQLDMGSLMNLSAVVDTSLDRLDMAKNKDNLFGESSRLFKYQVAIQALDSSKVPVTSAPGVTVGQYTSGLIQTLRGYGPGLDIREIQKRRGDTPEALEEIRKMLLDLTPDANLMNKLPAHLRPLYEQRYRSFSPIANVLGANYGNTSQ
jgi:hypothetical protein